MESAEWSLFYGSGEYSCLDVIVMMIYRDKRIDFLPGFGCFHELETGTKLHYIPSLCIYTGGYVCALYLDISSQFFYRRKPSHDVKKITDVPDIQVRAHNLIKEYILLWYGCISQHLWSTM